MEKEYSAKNTIDRIIEEKIPCIFVSPHLDDAILSAGDLISFLSKRTEVKVVNVFTEPSPRPYTLSAKAFLSQCGYKDADLLFNDRIREDREVFLRLNIDPVYLGFVDATWRKMTNMAFIRRILSNIIPELGHVYPVFRINISDGKVSSRDAELIRDLESKLKSIGESHPKSIVFCPLALRTHVDHTIVRDACLKVFQDNLILWSDFPYSLKNEVSLQNLDKMRLTSFEWSNDHDGKKKLIEGYESQFKGLFPDSKIKLSPEKYYLVSN